MTAILREILSVQDTRHILLALCDAPDALQYSALRRDLDIHAQAFKRSLDRLEHHAMIGRRLRGEPNNLGHRQVYLEATSIGHFWAERWKDWEKDTAKAAKAQHIPLIGQ